MCTDYKYIAKKTWGYGQLALSLEALRMVDDKELLSIPYFYEPLFDLILVGVVAKIEEYLKDRLFVEVHSSNEALYRYADVYVELNKKLQHRCKKWKEARDVNDVDEIKRLTDESLDRHIYHRIDMLNKFFKGISDLNIDQVEGYEIVDEMIKIRHKIIHPDNLPDKLPIYKIREYCDVGWRFIINVEHLFVSEGRCPIFEDPEN